MDKFQNISTGLLMHTCFGGNLNMQLFLRLQDNSIHQHRTNCFGILHRKFERTNYGRLHTVNQKDLF